MTVTSPVTFYQDSQGRYAGLEHDLAQLFARELKLRPSFVLAREAAQILPALAKGKGHFAAAGLRWRIAQGLDADDLLAKVADAAIEFTVVNSNQFEVARNFHPNLGAAFSVGPPVQIAWAFPQHAPPLLLDQAREFFERIRGNGLLQRLIDRYYGHVKRLSTNDIERFLEKTQSVLPKYRALFQRAEELTAIDWRLLAALGYQESQWNPLAPSPTNVRGLMMLSEDTADRLRVSDRLDARQSILAGSRYLQELRDQLPATVQEPDRTWLALAAYNLGFGHLRGGRALARVRKLNPDTWPDMKKMLPLLSRPEYAARLKSGAARGGEAVIMTENIRTYYDILARLEPAYKPVFPRLGASVGNVSTLKAD
ncbi:MAG: membrane-bound lytic murein transglycosylase MltF [Betaproteobacteria bacterium]|nr:membrane-bound lytic murein transglycosylase MltF [Betaproteobacteria bacterium]